MQHISKLLKNEKKSAKLPLSAPKTLSDAYERASIKRENVSRHRQILAENQNCAIASFPIYKNEKTS